MEKFKNLVNILIMIYLVIALLVYLGILNVGQQTNPAFYTNFFLAGGLLMLLELITENVYSWLLKKQQKQQYQHQINELKARLYDQEQQLRQVNRPPQPTQHRQQPSTGHVPPQPRATAYQPVLTPLNPDIILDPAALPPPPANPADFVTKKPDSDTYREPNH